MFGKFSRETTGVKLLPQDLSKEAKHFWLPKLKLIDSFDLCGGQGISMSGQNAGEYEIKAYTAVRAAIRGGRLEVEAHEVSVFWLFEND